jgi:hypothetical protein
MKRQAAREAKSISVLIRNSVARNYNQPKPSIVGIKTTAIWFIEKLTHTF